MEIVRPRPLVIVKLGETFESLRERRGDFEHWIAAGLSGSRLPLVVLDPRHGDLLPDPGEISGAIVTGSHAMVSDREAWSEHTAAWLRRLIDADMPLLGICYGHQLLAHALGGEAGDHPRGLEAGTVPIHLAPLAAADPLLRGLPSSIEGQAAHRQSVRRLPPGAVLLAGNDFEPHQAFRVGRHAWGVQFHPEFDADIARAYVDHLADALRAQGADPQALADAVTGTVGAAQILGRFGRLVEEHDAQTPTPAPHAP